MCFDDLCLQAASSLLSTVLKELLCHDPGVIPGKKIPFQDLKESLLSNGMRLIANGTKIVERIYQQKEKYGRDAGSIWCVCHPS